MKFVTRLPALLLACKALANAAKTSIGSVSSLPRRSALRIGSAGLAWQNFGSAAHSIEEFGDQTANQIGRIGGQLVQGDESLMSQKAHGTTESAVQPKLRWNVDRETADRICSFNRRFAEYAGYWTNTAFLEEARQTTREIVYYDSVSGKPLFVAPRGRSMTDFLVESNVHGWPSFRDQEVVWSNVRVLRDGETVSVDGTHLGHNLPDRNGNRFCINLVSVSGNPAV
mmetsp:Transcript_52131/g.86454  ORF Transcript_52131/g.86454 Transcript_52131/m.86454 type:complete len:227 (-) Transcript_52131:168-848(-)|eukprot:CAMPEP_0119336786 /NCGR_PEP_ID=MMETSP1333-20130426/92565_1 /TAXON_ID=418940 /ORGANISM="Scyphosphaera apsteinii, Strain RCC1455" /LENGTH=226 /DNA_ID=CAMNT_0007347653 /DNA_START=41 /DNA_END=721 /DNA_ORIENTATION=+